MKAVIDRDKTFEGFMNLRAKVNNSLDYFSGPKSFFNVFDSIKKDAGNGDAISQDVLAYYYKSGIEDFLYEDYTKYLKWELLSGANGNSFAIEKLQFLFGYTYDSIVAHEDFPLMKYLNDIDEYNYIVIIGQVICDEVVKHLELDEKTLAEEEDSGDEFRAEVFRDYRKAIDACMENIIKRLKKEA
jgi:hypothetical protein